MSKSFIFHSLPRMFLSCNLHWAMWALYSPRTFLRCYGLYALPQLAKWVLAGRAAFSFISSFLDFDIDLTVIINCRHSQQPAAIRNVS